jgi:hypothetical protein
MANGITLIVCRLIVVRFSRWRSVESRPSDRIRKTCPRAANRTSSLTGEARRVGRTAPQLRRRDRARGTERQPVEYREASARPERQTCQIDRASPVRHRIRIAFRYVRQLPHRLTEVGETHGCACASAATRGFRAMRPASVIASVLKVGDEGAGRTRQKHIGRYCNEFSYRFNRRGEQLAMFDETLKHLARGEKLSYAKLTRVGG